MTSPTHPPRVTVGVPVYNGERYLPATLDSLLQQTVDDFVIVIGDNASTDGTEAIARAYMAKDPRVRYVRHPRNLGAAENYNVLCRMAETEFFRWCAADDCAKPRFLEACLAGLAADPEAVLVYPRIQIIDGEGRAVGEYDERLHLPLPRAADRFFTFLDNVRLCNALYGVARTAVLQRTRLMGSFRGSDMVFQAELTLYGKILEVPEVLMLRRIHDQAFTKMTRDEQQQFYRPGRRGGLEFYAWRHLGEHLRSVARAPLAGTERLRLFRGLARRAIWGRDTLVRELLQPFRSSGAGRES